MRQCFIYLAISTHKIQGCRFTGNLFLLNAGYNLPKNEVKLIPDYPLFEVYKL